MMTGPRIERVERFAELLLAAAMSVFIVTIIAGLWSSAVAIAGFIISGVLIVSGCVVLVVGHVAGRRKKERIRQHRRRNPPHA
jgi:hypothetical protein